MGIEIEVLSFLRILLLLLRLNAGRFNHQTGCQKKVDDYN
jgi:hypothetical protein